MKQLTILFLFCLAIISCQKNGYDDDAVHRALDDIGIPKHLSKFKYDAVTPKGIKIRSTVQVPAQTLADIDTGIDELLARYPLKYPQWTSHTKHSDYSVVFVDPMATNVETEPGSPAILVRGYQSAGTNIGACKTCFPPIHIVAPHQEKEGWRFRQYLINTIWFEGEHIFEGNDINVWQQYVGGNDSHPHVP
jgi:hypothetical protein